MSLMSVVIRDKNILSTVECEEIQVRPLGPACRSFDADVADRIRTLAGQIAELSAFATAQPST